MGSSDHKMDLECPLLTLCCIKFFPSPRSLKAWRAKRRCSSQRSPLAPSTPWTSLPIRQKPILTHHCDDPSIVIGSWSVLKNWISPIIYALLRSPYPSTSVHRASRICLPKCRRPAQTFRPFWHSPTQKPRANGPAKKWTRARIGDARPEKCPRWSSAGPGWPSNCQKLAKVRGLEYFMGLSSSSQ